MIGQIFISCLIMLGFICFQLSNCGSRIEMWRFFGIFLFLLSSFLVLLFQQSRLATAATRCGAQAAGLRLRTGRGAELTRGFSISRTASFGASDTPLPSHDSGVGFETAHGKVETAAEYIETQRELERRLIEGGSSFTCAVKRLEDPCRAHNPPGGLQPTQTYQLKSSSTLVNQPPIIGSENEKDSYFFL